MVYVYPGLISFRLEQKDNRVEFEVYEQACKTSGFLWDASPLNIKSSIHVELTKSIVYIIGGDESRSKEAKRSFPTSAEASIYHQNVLNVFRDWAGSKGIELQSPRHQMKQLSLWD